MLLKGLVRPKLTIYDLGIEVKENQVVEITNAQYSASPDAQQYLRRGLLAQVYNVAPTPVVVDLADVDKSTLKLRNEVVLQKHIDPAFLQSIGGAAVAPVFITDPVFSVGMMVVGGLHLLSWGNASLYYKGTTYALTAGHTADEGWRDWDNTVWVLTLNQNGTITQKFETLPYTPAINEVLAMAYDAGSGLFASLIMGITIVNQDLSLQILRIKDLFQIVGDFSFYPTGMVEGGTNHHVVMDGEHNVSVRRNEATTTAPTSSNDSSEGYGVMSLWVNTDTDDVYICTDATVDNAVWKQIG